MPLKGLKIHRNDREQNRRSTFEPYNLAKQAEKDGRGSDSLMVQIPDRGAVSQDGERPDLQEEVPNIIEPPDERPDTPPIQPSTPQTRRFSMLRFRHASDSHLSIKAKEHATRSTPPVPAVPNAPQIITTAPTVDESVDQQGKKPGRFAKLARRRMSFDPDSTDRPKFSTIGARKSMDKLRGGNDTTKRSMFGSLRGASNSRTSLNERGKLSTTTTQSHKAPGETGNAHTTLAPPHRASDSSRSDGSSGSGEHVTFVESQHRPQQLSSDNSFFRLPRRNKNRASFFPLPVKLPPPSSSPNTAPATPRASTSAVSNGSPNHSPVSESPPQTAFRTSHGDAVPTNGATSPSRNFLGRGHPLLRNDSTHSAHSARSSPIRLSRRGRSSTVNSISGVSEDMAPPTPPFAASGRNSTSTAGRSSLSTLFGLGARIRQNSEPHTPHQGSSSVFGTNSHHNSMNISRETLIIPEREEGETPGKYLERLQEVVHRSLIASIMSKKDDQFSHAVLRSYMRKFSLFGEPMDMSIRKLLLEVELPKETQQIDRVLQSFADRYHECNPGIYLNPEQAYFIAFSVVILHTDFFNKNNKRKMQKPDYVKIAAQEGVSDDVLGCFYDNTIYTPFIHFDDGLDHKEHKKSKKANAILKSPMNDPARKAIKEPVDPYTLILDNRLEVLRPPLKDVVYVVDPYTYGGTAQDLDVKRLHTSYAKYGVLQIVSARSRPDAFMNEDTMKRPEDAQFGLVEMPVTKVGILLRKVAKKKRHHTGISPWQEWGAVLTQNRLSFFKNANWVKDLMHQYEAHEKHASGTPVVFKPPIHDFQGDHKIIMDGAVSLMDTTYKNHKNTFAIFAKDGLEELFRADSEADMNDWLGKLNYTATFETGGVRPRGLVGGSYEGQRHRGMRRLESSHSTHTVKTSTGEVTIQSGKIDPELAQQIMTNRREVMQRKIGEAEEKIQTAAQTLSGHERDARHLLLLAPVQPKTREQLVHAAGRMSAKLKWVRIEIWRMKCHRDILLMDLEEERNKTKETEARIQAIAAGSPSPQKGKTSRLGGLARLSSKPSSSSQASTKSPLSPAASAQPSGVSSEEINEDIFKTPPQTSKQSSANQPLGQYELPHLSFSPNINPEFDRRESAGGSSTQSPCVGSAQRQGSISTLGEHVGTDAYVDPRSDGESQYETPDEDTPARPVTPRRERPGTASGSEQDTPSHQPTSPESRTRVRRSLHRTLRDSHGSGHRRSGKGKESSSTIMSDEGNESLSRREGSFTVHGKKASVINFGSEWQNMSAEERLSQTRRQTQEGRKMSTAGTVDSDGEGRPFSRQKPASITSNSTTTADNASLRPPPRHASPSRNSIAEEEEAVGSTDDEQPTAQRPPLQPRPSSGKKRGSDAGPPL